MRILLFTILALLGIAYSQGMFSEPEHQIPRSTKGFPFQLSEEEWKAKLGSQEYYVLRQAGTERAFTGKHWEEKRPGKYLCKGCGQNLFDARTKFKSGTGWPSFYAPENSKSVLKILDDSHGMMRDEIVCSNCGGHLGHVFEDGPPPTGLRYCMNSAALDFIPEENAN